MCDGVCTHTLLWHAYFSLLQSLQVILTHISMRVHTHARLKSVKRCCAVHVVSLRLALFILMFHPPSLLYPEGDFPGPLLVRALSAPKSRGMCTPHTRGKEFVYMAVSAHSTNRSRGSTLPCRMHLANGTVHSTFSKVSCPSRQAFSRSKAVTFHPCTF